MTQCQRYIRVFYIFTLGSAARNFEHDGSWDYQNPPPGTRAFDLSGLLRKDNDGNFAVAAADTGVAKRANDALVDINDESIVVTLQAGNLACGVIGAFQADRSGQWLLYQSTQSSDQYS